MECKLNSLNFRRLSNHGKTICLTFRVTGIFDDWKMNTMGDNVISLGTSHITGVNFRFTRDHLGVPAVRLGLPTTCHGAPEESVGAPPITTEHSGKIIFIANIACAPTNHSIDLSCFEFRNSCIQCILSSMY